MLRMEGVPATHCSTIPIAHLKMNNVKKGRVIEPEAQNRVLYVFDGVGVNDHHKRLVKLSTLQQLQCCFCNQ